MDLKIVCRRGVLLFRGIYTCTGKFTFINSVHKTNNLITIVTYF